MTANTWATSRFRAFASCLGLGLRPVLILIAWSASTLYAYPDFQKAMVKKTGRKINCAFCHIHSDGPVGTAPGQLGSLTPAEFERLGLARAAMEPGTPVENPLLNEFGNHIIQHLGKTRFLETIMAPENLAELLPPESDLDHDGITDADEYRHGTHPLISSDGRPWLLFTHNLKQNSLTLVLALLATILAIYGLYQLRVGFARQQQSPSE